MSKPEPVRNFYQEAVAIVEGRYLAAVLPEHVIAMHRAKLVFFHAYSELQKNLTVFLAHSTAQTVKEMEAISATN